jgi:hypothetical protein
MKYLVIKVKDKDLFFNADEAMGEYVCSTPMLLDKDQADSIMKYCPDKIWTYGDEDEWVNKDQLEVKEVTLNFC